jgi:hypothetical protein
LTIKITAFGFIKYISDSWNLLDCIVAVDSTLDIVFAIIKVIAGALKIRKLSALSGKFVF